MKTPQEKLVEGLKEKTEKRELKTLKDLEFECEWKYDTFKALKQEAIKHLNFFENVTINEMELKGWEDWGIKDFIKYFFNISEKDLRGNN